MLQRKLAKDFETTYFEGEHLKIQSFDKETQLKIEANLNQPHDDPEHEIK